MARRFAVLDVFTDTPLTGNGLAVVRDAGGLTSEAMQAIARGFNLSETVFLLPADGPAHTAKMRIFTPARELPFAGHPTVGAAVLLTLDRFEGDAAGRDAVVVIEEEVGPVRCGVATASNRAGYAEFDVPRIAGAIPCTLDRDAVAGALGLLPSEIGFENHVPSAYDAGVPFTFVPVANLDAARKAAPILALWKSAFGPDAPASVYLYCRDTIRSDASFHARMFAPTFGIGEDPATGAAASAFAGVVHRFDAPPDGEHKVAIEQGVEMGRPSLIRLELEIARGAIANARIGGDAVVIQEGELFV
ncbi:PhzF family phenazine biosynthesis protein [Segnochrobactrum spirostomi]|uniref:PhzF family phenazine biosynthesis protein n=1 Tax=Segnochrobactrum spirostomi TaxID=2608987 RepID=A0A6A7XYS4_9HYPH|nr:PhzF family phenazine biosynthesis protein [Segnochrobactrum spirostomi]MQT11468.1 PhzF family phenazine biosynthesis protein [Segnochrobactrum spirostomi]